MARARADVTETELAILDVLWNKGSCEARDIVESIYNRHTPALHATVKSLLARLSEKQLVECQPKRFAHTYRATIDRETYVGKQLQQLADSHFNGALAPMILTMVDRVKLSQNDREKLRNIIEQL